MTSGVRARDLRVTRGGGTAVDGVDLDVGPGEVAVLAGPSGSGKSSLLLALAGLLGPDPAATVQGDVSVAGLDPGEAPAREVARRVGVLFQRPRDQLLALDVGTEVALKLERLGVPPEEVPGRVEAALERVGAAPLASRGTATLSGGEAKRVALAQALAGDPDVLLLDEPLADLDPEGRNRFVDLVSDLADGAAVLVAEHRLDALVPAADRVVGLRDGARAPLEDATPEPPAFDEAPPAGPTLRLEGVTASPGDEPALADLDVALPPGLTGVAGPNGAGKTTLLRVLAGLLEPQAGTVRLGGDPLEAPAHQRARRVGYAPQHPDAVFHRPTVEDEIAWGPRNLGAPCDPAAVAEAHRLGPHRRRHPHTLSGGEAERLAWAAAHAHDPPVRLLDEPTTGLDPAARRVLARRLGRARGRGHALVATHDPWLLAAADRVLLLEEAGPRLGPPEDVLGDPYLPAREAGAAPARRVHP